MNTVINTNKGVYTPACPQIVIDTKELVLTVNGVVQTDYEGNPLMDEKKWLEYRKTGIGGSDASTVLGCSPWRTRQQLADEKRGVNAFSTEKKNTVALTIGHMFESVIRYKVLPYLMEQEGIKNFRIEEDSHMYRHGNTDYSFALADIDGLCQVGGQLGIIEIKTTSWRNKDVIEEWQNGIVPSYYEAQCRHYMAVMNLPFVYICCAWGFNPDSEAVLIRIDRDLVLEQQLMDAEREFWHNHVVAGELVTDEACSPSLARDYYARRMVRNKNENPVELDAGRIVPLVNERQNLLARIEAAEREKNAAKEELDGVELSIMQALGNDERGTYLKDSTHRIYVNAISKLENRTYDTDKIRDNFPDLYALAAETKFSVSKLTKNQQAKIAPYQLPQKPSGKVAVSVKEVELGADGKPLKKARGKKTA